MAAFQETREQTEQKVMMHLLSEIERNQSFTQRGLAQELGIALGLMNQYLKRCVTKGWVRASQISPRRLVYFLTPEGFKEKSSMAKDYLFDSLSFFRTARAQCEAIIATCCDENWKKLGLVGSGDLADIAQLVSHGTGIELEVLKEDANFKLFDAVLITDVQDPQGTYNTVLANLKDQKVETHRLLTLKLSHISRGAL